MKNIMNREFLVINFINLKPCQFFLITTIDCILTFIYGLEQIINMLKFVTTFIAVFLAWILLTGSLEFQELFAGILVSLLIASISRNFLFHKSSGKALNPIRWVNFFIYVVVFIYIEILSHIDLSYRVLTGKINPAIIKTKTKLKTDIGRTMLANSITLTPGTLTLEANENLFIHWIGFDKKKKVGELFEKYAFRVTE